MKKIYSIAILRPAGNDTALVRCLVNETNPLQAILQGVKGSSNGEVKFQWAVSACSGGMIYYR